MTEDKDSKTHWRPVMPLIGSSFKSGSAQEVVNQIEDKELAVIARAELHYFCGEAAECAALTKPYLEDEDISIRLSANMMYAFSNLTLGNPTEAQISREHIRDCLEIVMRTGAPEEIKAACVFAAYISTVLLHIPPEGLPAIKDYIRYLPVGQRLYAVYLSAHNAYLKKEYEVAIGMVESALMMVDEVYPISMIYLYCIMAVCQMNLKDTEGARKTFLKAFEMARPDKFIEPFIEHHGPLQGLVESCIRKTEPQLYKKILDQIIAFSRGWMKIHNPEAQKSVTSLLTPLEFSIAMLACRDWTNQEIADYLELSVNTVKHYISVILEKLDVDKREKLREYVNQ